MGTAQRYPGQIIPRRAGASIADGAVVVVGSDDERVALPAEENGDVGIIGIAVRDGGGSYASGEMMDVMVAGVYPAIAAATIVRGQWLTVANASGHVKAIGPTAGQSVSCIGVAIESAASGERVAVLIIPRANPFMIVQPFTAEGAITLQTAVKVGTADNKVVPATADPTAGLVGVALNTAADGETVYVCTHGTVPVVSQANITRGQNVTIGNASGHVKPAAPGAGTNAQLLGTAMASATAPAVANINVNVNMMQG